MLNQVLKTKKQNYLYHSLSVFQDQYRVNIQKIPYSIRILLENVLRNDVNQSLGFDQIANLFGKSPSQKNVVQEIPFNPGRIVLQDFTGVPCLVDLAAMRSAMTQFNKDPLMVNPQVPCDLVIDHSVQVDHFGSEDALKKNMKIEFERNMQRYAFLKWGQNSLDNLRIVPPGKGIVHQVNLECLASVVLCKKTEKGVCVFPDTVIGTDSHTTMINSLGVLGWGVGGIEAESVMLGDSLFMQIPPVVGFELTGRLRDGVTATDLVLTVTNILRKKGVIGKFVEFYGEALSHMDIPDRATIANMAPEYGATMGFFPVDEFVLNYLKITGRDSDLVDLVERYCKEQLFFYDQSAPIPEYTSSLHLDLDTVVASLAGPRKPYERVNLPEVKHDFQNRLHSSIEKGGFDLADPKGDLQKNVSLKHGDIVIASITSCTNTSNPFVIIGAALIAKNAVERGLTLRDSVKSSFAPGSRVVKEYLEAVDLLSSLNKLGFNIVGYGCTTCIGNSGPLNEEIVQEIQENQLVVASVLSGNRNFEGRIHQHVKANYLMSPMLVIAYALSGSLLIDFETEALGMDTSGNPVYLRDIWPSEAVIRSIMKKAISKKYFDRVKQNVFKGNSAWTSVESIRSDVYEWDSESTYIQNPPFFEKCLPNDDLSIRPIMGARVLLKLGNSITTDHISPAGAINPESPAGRFLIEKGVSVENFNSYGSRRGNDHVMVRGTFANVRLRNQLLSSGREGGYTVYFPEGKEMSVYDASILYKKNAVPLIVLAGFEYGTGSSRDWAAKGTSLLGVRVVIAKSYERIHRSNLIGMGILPLEFLENESHEILGLTGEETFDFPLLDDSLKIGGQVAVVAKKTDGKKISFQTKSRIDIPVEREYFRHGGMLLKIFREFLQK